MSGDASLRDGAIHERRFARTAFFITGGLLIWIANFVFVYVFVAVACARGFAAARLGGIAVVPLTTTLASVIAGAATAALFWFTGRTRARQDDEATRFIRFVAHAGCVLALIAFVWIALPPLVIQACGRP